MTVYDDRTLTIRIDDKDILRGAVPKDVSLNGSVKLGGTGHLIFNRVVIYGEKKD